MSESGIQSISTFPESWPPAPPDRQLRFPIPFFSYYAYTNTLYFYLYSYRLPNARQMLESTDLLIRISPQAILLPCFMLASSVIVLSKAILST